ncbi:TRAP transporter large permease [Clostridiaceae bacterium 35-E11]
MGVGIIFILFIAFIVGIPISFSLGLVSLGGVIAMKLPLMVVVQRMFTGADSFPLVAIPLFVFAGGLMFQGGMSKRLVSFSDALIGHFPSGLAMVSVLACMFFAAITGSAIAATAAIGGLMIPLMVQQGYDAEFAAPLLATAGSIGPIIPPSIPLLLYGVIANASVAKLFIGGFVPGILMGLALMVFSYIIGKKRNYRGRDKRAPLSDIIKYGKDAFLALLTPIIIIGGIMSGVFTATESGAIAVAYSLVIGLFVYKELTMKKIYELLLDTAKTTGIVLIVVAFASLFTWVLTINQLPQQVTALLGEVAHNKIILLLIINIILLIAGTFIDTVSALVIFAPLFLPLTTKFGIDPIHFGLILSVNLTIGMCTPPLGVCLFVSSSIAKVSLKDMMKDLIPLLIALLIVLAMVTYIPQTVLWLPNLLVK